MTLRMGALALTPALRRVAYRQARTILPKHFSSSAHSAPNSSGDKPWIVRRLVSLPFVNLTSTRSAVLVDRLCAHLHSDGQVFDICNAHVSHSQRRHSIDSLSVFTLCAFQATSDSQRYESWPASCRQRPSRADQSMSSLLPNICSGRLSTRPI
jgi:hypothetical protein